jgi:cytochrome c-type biogenesis protein CcmH
MRRLLAISALFLAASSAMAVEPDEQLADPALEARARDISRDIRCVVCQSENIDDSNAPLARDLRLLVRERLVAGDSDEAVVDYLVDRYGDFVLLKPRVQKNTIFLWAAPIAAAAAGAIGLWSVLRSAKSREDKPKPLTPEEADALNRLE